MANATSRKGILQHIARMRPGPASASAMGAWTGRKACNGQSNCGKLSGMKHSMHAVSHAMTLAILSACCSTVLPGSQAQPGLQPGYMPGAAPQWLGPAGSRRAALLVHGFLGCGENLGSLPQALADAGWRVRVMLLPGHGTRSRDIMGVSAEEWRLAVEREYAALCERHGEVLVVGHSLGGALAALAAAKAERPPCGLVLCAPYFGVAHRWWYGLRPETWLAIARPVIPWTYKGKLFMQVNRPEAKDVVQSYPWAPTSAMGEVMRVGQWVNSDETLQGVTCPVLWIHAPGDRAAAYEAAEWATKRMSGEVEHLRLDRSNHLIFHDYEREAVVERIIEFSAGL